MSQQKAPPAPDYTPIAEMSKENAILARESAREQLELGREQLAWAKEQFGTTQVTTGKLVDLMFRDSERASTLAQKASLRDDKIADKQMAIADENSANARKDRTRYEGTFQPLEDDLAREAKEFGTQGRKDLEVGRATAAVAQQFEGARTAAQRSLEGFGVNPGATRFAALDLGVRTQQAAAAAGAGNQASQMVDATGRALRSEAINVGRGYPGQIAGTTNTALQAGAGAVNAGGAGVGAINSGAAGWGASQQILSNGNGVFGTAQPFFGNANASMNTSNGALGTWGNMLGQGYKDQMSTYKANESSSSGWGSALGLGMTMAGMFKDGGMVEGPQEGRMHFVQGGKIDHPNHIENGNGDLSCPSCSGSRSFHDGKHEVLIPTMSRDGKRVMSEHEAMNEYAKTGKHLGKFASRQPAGEYADMLHTMQLKMKKQGVKPLHAASGGAIHAMDGGAIPDQVSPSGGANTDDIKARLSAGEFIMPEQAVSWFGEKHFYKLVETAQKDREEMKQKTGAVPEMKMVPAGERPGAIPMQEAA